MNQERPLIKLYRTRTFSEKMSDTFDFVRENWRTMLKFLTYMMLPLSLVQTFAMNNFMTGYMSFSTAIDSANFETMLPWLSSMGVTMVFYFIAMILVNALTYTMMQLYEQRQERLQGITFADLQPAFMNKCGRQLVLLLTGFVLMILFALIIFLLTVINPVLPVLGAVVVFLLLPLFMLVHPVYLFEKTGVISAYAKSIRLGWKTWAGVVAVITVLYIMVTIVESVVSMPWYIMLTLKSAFATQGSEPAFMSSFVYTAIQYLLGAVSNFFGNCMLTLLIIGLAYQYGHACDKVDGVTVDRDIENFETLNVE